MHTSKKSLSKSTVYQEEAEELRKISQDRSRTYSGGHIEKMKTPKGDIKMNINGTDCQGTTEKKTSQADNTVLDQFISDTKLQHRSDSVNSDEIREKAKEII